MKSYRFRPCLRPGRDAEDEAACLTTCLDPGVGGGDVGQQQHPVDGRAKHAGGGELGEELEVFAALRGRAAEGLPAPPEGQDGPEELGEVGGDHQEAAAVRQDGLAAGGAGGADAVHDDVEGAALLCKAGVEVAVGVVQSLGGGRGREAADHVEVRGGGDAGDRGPEVVTELDGGGADRTGGADDEEALSGGEARAVAEETEGRRAPEREGGGGVEGNGRRLLHDCAGGRDDTEFGVGAHPGAGEGDDGVARGEVGDAGADGVDEAGELGAEDGLTQLAEAEGEAEESAESARRLPRAEAPVGGGDGRRDDADADLAAAGDGAGPLDELDDVGGP
jgi:hypothetical protein